MMNMIYRYSILSDFSKLKYVANDGTKVVVYKGMFMVYDYDTTITTDQYIAGIPVLVKSNVLTGGWRLQGSSPTVLRIYVSNNGNDNNNGLSPTSPIKSTQGLINALNLNKVTGASEEEYYDASAYIIELVGVYPDGTPIPEGSTHNDSNPKGDYPYYDPDSPSLLQPDVANFYIEHKIRFFQLSAKHVRFVYVITNPSTGSSITEDFNGQIQSINDIYLKNCAVNLVIKSGDNYIFDLNLGRNPYFSENPVSKYGDKTPFWCLNGSFYYINSYIDENNNEVVIGQLFLFPGSYKGIYSAGNPLVRVDNQGANVIVKVTTLRSSASRIPLSSGKPNFISVTSPSVWGYSTGRSEPYRDIVSVDLGLVIDNPYVSNPDMKFKALDCNSNLDLQRYFRRSVYDMKDTAYSRLGIQLPDLKLVRNSLVLEYTRFSSDRIYAGLSSPQTNAFKYLNRYTFLTIYWPPYGSGNNNYHYACKSILPTNVINLSPLQTAQLALSRYGSIIDIKKYVSNSTSNNYDLSISLPIDLNLEFGNYTRISRFYISGFNTSTDYYLYVLEFSDDAITWTTYGWRDYYGVVPYDGTNAFKGSVSYNFYAASFMSGTDIIDPSYVKRYMRLRIVGQTGSPTTSSTTITFYNIEYQNIDIANTLVLKRFDNDDSSIVTITNISSSTVPIVVYYKFI